MTATAPFAKPTAIWDRSSSVANAEIYSDRSHVLVSRNYRVAQLPQGHGHTGNCRRPLLIVTVLRQVGMFVFFTSLSKAHALSTGSLLISS